MDVGGPSGGLPVHVGRGPWVVPGPVVHITRRLEGKVAPFDSESLPVVDRRLCPSHPGPEVSERDRGPGWGPDTSYPLDRV